MTNKNVQNSQESKPKKSPIKKEITVQQEEKKNKLTNLKNLKKEKSLKIPTLEEIGDKLKLTNIFEDNYTLRIKKQTRELETMQELKQIYEDLSNRYICISEEKKKFQEEKEKEEKENIKRRKSIFSKKQELIERELNLGKTQEAVNNYMEEINKIKEYYEMNSSKTEEEIKMVKKIGSLHKQTMKKKALEELILIDIELAEKEESLKEQQKNFNQQKEKFFNEESQMRIELELQKEELQKEREELELTKEEIESMLNDVQEKQELLVKERQNLELAKQNLENEKLKLEKEKTLLKQQNKTPQKGNFPSSTHKSSPQKTTTTPSKVISPRTASKQIELNEKQLLKLKQEIEKREQAVAQKEKEILEKERLIEQEKLKKQQMIDKRNKLEGKWKIKEREHNEQLKKQIEENRDQQIRIIKEQQEKSQKEPPKRESIFTPTLRGLDKEIAMKLASKYDVDMEKAALKWIEDVLGKKLPEHENDRLYQVLNSGIILCELINIIFPGKIANYNKVIDPRNPKLGAKDNIAAYCNACIELGMPSHETFSYGDLGEKKLLSGVLNNLFSLGRLVQKLKPKFTPILGLKIKTNNNSSILTKKWEIPSNTNFMSK